MRAEKTKISCGGRGRQNERQVRGSIRFRVIKFVSTVLSPEVLRIQIGSSHYELMEERPS